MIRGHVAHARRFGSEHMSSGLQSHLRKTILAGVFAVVPVVVTAWAIWYIDSLTRIISVKLFNRPIPFVGILIAVAAIYLVGLVATTLLGKWIIGMIDRLLSRVPGFRQLYAAWKQVSFTPGGGEGMFARVVLVGESSTPMRQLGFTSGEPIGVGSDGSQRQMLCVFVPNAPNPLQGRMYFVDRAMVQMTDLSSEEAFKLILSTGNYIPPQLAGACGPTPPVAMAVPGAKAEAESQLQERSRV
jgi:uncharacterized membrane protein